MVEEKDKETIEKEEVVEQKNQSKSIKQQKNNNDNTENNNKSEDSKIKVEQVAVTSDANNIEEEQSKDIPAQPDEKKEDSPKSIAINSEKAISEVKEQTENNIQNNEEPKKHKKSILNIFLTIILVLLSIVALAFTVFTVLHLDNSKVSKGISILGLDVSGLTKPEAINKINDNLSILLSNNIDLVHNEYETNLSIEEIEVQFDVEDAVDQAFFSGKGSNAIFNSFKKLKLLYEPIDITPTVTLNEEQLEKSLNNISTQLPDAVIDSSYYIDGNNLIITSGKNGVIIDNKKMIDYIIDSITNLTFINNKLDIATISKEPSLINIEDVYNKIHKDAKDAFYTTNPFVVYPAENGVDFAISLDEAKQMLLNKQEEYSIPLKVLYPKVTTNMIGTEAFPDLIASFSTNYAASNRDRTTNLRLAANKINGTVLLPGETFSYNTVVGQRSIAAGYKEAAIYQNGQVVNGLGGGICQISTTLFNAALYANLQIVERRNHQFVPSYIGAGRDATVVYGSQDFKFKNPRDYAIKIIASVEGGVAKMQIYGLRQPNEYEVIVSSNVTSRTSSYIKSATYRTLKQNGQTISTETIAHDTYKVH